MKVYLAPLVCNTMFKIGKANDVRKRISSLSRDHDFNTSKIVVLRCHNEKASYLLEGTLHKMCGPMRVHIPGDGGTEFFEMDAWDAALAGARAFGMVHQLSEIQYRNCEPADCSDDVRQTLADVVKFNRLRRNMTQDELADFIGVSRRTISRFENGEDITSSNLAAIFAQFGFNEHLRDLIECVPERKNASQPRRPRSPSNN